MQDFFFTFFLRKHFLTYFHNYDTVCRNALAIRDLLNTENGGNLRYLSTVIKTFFKEKMKHCFFSLSMTLLLVCKDVDVEM